MDPSRARHRFGGLSQFEAEAIGEPGHRTFRLILKSGDSSATLWLEKEQLYQLAVHLHEIMESLSSEGAAEQGEAPEPESSVGSTSLEFTIGKLALGHDNHSNCLLLLAHDVEETDEGQATLSFWLTLSQGEELAKDALNVCSAGRPRCFLCSQPINPEGHMCPRANGHAPLQN